MNAKKAPVPNAANVATVQGAENVNAATGTQQLNQTNQVTPLGGITYTQTPGGPGGLPTYTATQTLSPAEQALLTQQQGNQSAANTAVGNTLATYQPLNLSNNAVTADIANTYAPLFNQQEAIQQEALNSSLNNEGLHTGDPAYNIAQENFGLTQSDAWNNILETARAQSVNEMIAQSQIPVQNATSLAALGTPQFPSTLSTPQTSIQPVNSSSDVYNSAQIAANNAQMANANTQAMWGGLAGLGSAALTGGATLMKPPATTNFNFA